MVRFRKLFPPLDRVFGCPGLVGINNPELGSGAEHHNERFDIDEDALEMGVKTTVAYVLSLMHEGLPEKLS